MERGGLAVKGGTWVGGGEQGCAVGEIYLPGVFHCGRSVRNSEIGKGWMVIGWRNWIR